MGGTYQDLKAWQRSMDLAAEVYSATASFPKAEIYGLTSQLRRAVVSVPSNIAEGKGRSTDKELLVFLGHARGSLLELETQLILANRLGYLVGENAEKLLRMVTEVGRLLNGFMSSLRTPTVPAIEVEDGKGARARR